VTADIRQLIDNKLNEALRAGNETFNVPLPDHLVNSLQLEPVLEEYRDAGWTVGRGSQRNDHYLWFRG